MPSSCFCVPTDRNGILILKRYFYHLPTSNRALKQTPIFFNTHYFLNSHLHTIWTPCRYFNQLQRSAFSLSVRFSCQQRSWKVFVFAILSTDWPTIRAAFDEWENHSTCKFGNRHNLSGGNFKGKQVLLISKEKKNDLDFRLICLLRK